MSLIYCFTKWMRELAGPYPVHATYVERGLVKVLYSDDSVRVRSIKDPKIRKVLKESEKRVRKYERDNYRKSRGYL
jgi:hypothetical protein